LAPPSRKERIERLIILDKDGDYCPLAFWPEQEKIYQLVVEQMGLRGDADILKDRRIGVSTLLLAVFYDEVKTRKGVNAQVITHHPDASKEFREIIKRFWLYDEDRPLIQYDNAGTFSVKGQDSRIYIGTVESSGEGRARTIHLLLCTEVARWPEREAQELWSGFSQAAQRGLRIRESTPHGRGNFHHREWKKAREKRPESCLFFRWFDHDEYRADWPARNLSNNDEDIYGNEVAVSEMYGLDLYQLAWRREMIEELGKDGFTQEYPEDEETCFLVTGETVFEKAILLKLLRATEYIQPLEQREELTVWEYPTEGEYYVAFSDVGEGLPLGDRSATVVLRWKTGRQVARLWGCLPPEEFAMKSAALCTMYNNALWGIEEAEHGKTVLYIVTAQSPYANLYYRDKNKPGWRTDRGSRPTMLDQLKRGIREGSIGVMDKDFVLECLSFVRTDAYPDGEADAGAHDDLVMANAGVWRLRALSGPPSPIKIRELLPS